jgi:hypothetical protein
MKTITLIPFNREDQEKIDIDRICHFKVERNGETAYLKKLPPLEQARQDQDLTIRIAIPLARYKKELVMSKRQQESTFNLIVGLHERFRDAEIKADYSYCFSNEMPDFITWLNYYKPIVIQRHFK